jgi:hypothetical protein
MSAQPAATSQACFCRRPPVLGISAKPTDRRRLKENPTAGGLARGARRAAGSPRWLWKGSAGDPFMGRVTLVTVPPIYDVWGADSRFHHAVGGVLSAARSGARRASRSQARPSGLALSGRGRRHRRRQGDTASPLLPLLQRKGDRAFLAEAQLRTAEWNRLLDQVETTARSPLRPQMLIRVVTDLLADNAIISLDCGANTHFAARCLRLRADQRFTGTGMLASMAPGLPYAIAAKLAYPDRQSVPSSATAVLRC